MRLIWLVAASLLVSTSGFAQAPGPWSQPASALAAQIAGILGPGQANLSIRNLSGISPAEIPAIRALLEQDLKAVGIQASGAESANSIRVTLSENLRERLWVAEVVQGNETRVAMVQIDPGTSSAAAEARTGLVLRKQILLETKQPVLAAVEFNGWAVAAFPEALILYGTGGGIWKEARRVELASKWPLGRDPRGQLSIAPAQYATGFEGHLGRLVCQGAFGINDPDGHWVASCGTSDDPWPIAQIPGSDGAAQGANTIKAFYNSSRNYFTGVVTPSVGVDLPPFYSAAALPRPAGAALLIGGIDGRVQLVDAGALKPVSGTRDWGSDFSALRSGCGEGYQVIASGSGEAISDSLRAYEFPNREAAPVSQPLAMNGSVIALWTALDGKSIYASIRKQQDAYEVDRVTALCN